MTISSVILEVEDGVESSIFVKDDNDVKLSAFVDEDGTVVDCIWLLAVDNVDCIVKLFDNVAVDSNVVVVGFVVSTSFVEVTSDVGIESDLLVNKILAWEVSSSVLLNDVNFVVEVVSLDDIDVTVDNWSLFVDTVDVSWIIFDVVIIRASEVAAVVASVFEFLNVDDSIIVGDIVASLVDWTIFVFDLVTEVSSVVLIVSVEVVNNVDSSFILSVVDNNWFSVVFCI